MHSKIPHRRRIAARAGAITLAAVLAGAASGAFAGTRYTVLASFDGADGSAPAAGLTVAPDGSRVGITTNSQIGGNGGPAVIYRVRNDGTLKVLHVFAADGSEGLQPQSPLLASAGDGWLYGVAPEGGAADGLGTLFRVATDGRFELLHAFTAADDASGHPSGALARGSDGTIYGTTAGGAPGLPGDRGAVFGRKPDGSFSWLRFAGADDGATPMGGVVLGRDGRLHGTTSAGGVNGGGVLFSTSADFASFETQHAFSCIIDGCAPRAAVVEDADGRIFGTTSRGGNGGGAGTVFKSANGKFFTVHTFTSPDTAGRFPIGGLAVDAAGQFWGTTSLGGSAQGGTLFRMSAKGKVAVQHAFGGEGDGAQPWCTPAVLADGTVQGTTLLGGANGLGVVWRLKPGK